MTGSEQNSDIPPTARLFWVGHHFRIRSTHTDRYELECTDGVELYRTLYRSKVAALLHCRDLSVEPYFFDLDGKPADTSGRARLLTDMPVAEQRKAMVDYILVRELDKDYRAGKVKLYETQPPPKSGRRRRHTGAETLDVWLHRNRARLYALCRPYFLLDPDAPLVLEKPKKGQPGPPSLGSPSNLKLAYRKFRDKGFSIVDLAPNKDAMRNGGRRMAPDMARFCENHIRAHLNPERMNLSALRRDIQAALTEIPSMRHRCVPSPQALENLIDSLNQAQVTGALFGIERMEHERTITTKGQQFHRIGEKVIMDCWKVDQVSLIREGDGWILVNEDLKEEWGVRRRLWVCMAMDACSRVILGMALGFSESSELTRQALRMVITDKTDWARDAGCRVSPVPAVRPESILTDPGSAFKDPLFVMQALDLSKSVDVGPAKKAHLRGLKERFFRTVKDQVLGYFTGTTFGNVVLKGDYDSMGRASLVDADLGRGLFLYMNDVYNLTGHRGLKRQPPIDRFNEQYSKYGGFPLPSEEEVKVIFGLDVRLPVTRQGCWFAGNHYWSGKLGAYFRDNGPCKLRAKVDPLDLGQIMVLIAGTWVRLAGPPEMHAIGMTSWIAELESIKVKHRTQEAVRWDIVAEALRKLREMGTAARLKANVLDMSYDSETIVAAANRIRIHFVERAKPTQPGALLATDTTSREASFETSGGENSDIDLECHDASPIVPPDYEAPAARPNTELGLDDADIDQDGDVIEEDASDEEHAPPEATDQPAEQATPPLPALPPETFEFLQQPVRRK